MNDEVRQQIALFRYGILAPLISGTYDGSNSKKGFFVMLRVKPIPIQEV